jgi:monoamine oxidase
MDVIIIGAGAAGLMAAKQLSEAGVNVCVVEARDRLGGRIYSFENKDNGTNDGGAEFIHGNLELTLALLEEAGVEKKELEGEMWQYVNGKWSRERDFFAHTEMVIEKLQELEDDCSIASFLDKYFAGEEYEGLRNSLTSYIEGYYSGEVTKASAKSFLVEWQNEDDQQYRPAGGYGPLVRYLMESSIKAGAVFHLSVVVKEVRWTAGRVEVIDEENRNYTAQKAIVTVPTGVWLADENEKGSIRYTPALAEKKAAAGQLGFGSVIKILLGFNEPFYAEELLKKNQLLDLSSLHMAVSDHAIPTWWTQYPNHSSVLTGWLSGPKAAALKDESEETILSIGLQSLVEIFDVNRKELKENLRWWKVFNWTNDPFTRGSYSYSTLHTTVDRKTLASPVEQTLFFAGEALYDGPEMGTVEAALISGKDVALQILDVQG